MTYKDQAFYGSSLSCIRDRQWHNISWCHNIFRKRATNHRALLWKMIYKDKAFYGSSPSCIRDRQSTHAQLTYTHTSNPQTHRWHTCSLNHIHAHELQWHNFFWNFFFLKVNPHMEEIGFQIITTAKRLDLKYLQLPKYLTSFPIHIEHVFAGAPLVPKTFSVE